ncbi:MAG TPA: hypothetical protein VK669_05085 [Candidatus Limnocylindrales bacterium]|nr:hypothetical protein [Candidatus Limnocylindrales bacterium]
MSADLYVLVAAVTILSTVASSEPQARETCRPQIRFVDFPSRIDPLGEHRHVPLEVGSRVYVRRSIRIREFSATPHGGTFEQTEAVDAESRITRCATETVVVEPSGAVRHFAADAVIDRSEPARNYMIVVIPPDRLIPAYLRKTKPDIIVR